MYNHVYRTLSESVHGRPETLRANCELSRPWRVSRGELEVANTYWWPLIIWLFIKPLLVSGQLFGWPDADEVRRVHNRMYSVEDS